MHTGYRAAKIASKKAKNSQFLVRFRPLTSGGLWRARRAPRIESFASEGCPEPLAMPVWSRGGVFGAGLVRQNVRRRGSFFFVAREICLPIATEAVTVCMRACGAPAARPWGSLHVCAQILSEDLENHQFWCFFGRFSQFLDSP